MWHCVGWASTFLLTEGGLVIPGNKRLCAITDLELIVRHAQ